MVPLTIEHLALHTKTLPAPGRPKPARGKKGVVQEDFEVVVGEATSYPEITKRPLDKEASPCIALLRASPPIPVGSLPGRYKVRLWRAAADLPWGLAFGRGSLPRAAVVAEDAIHLGLRKGDEVLSVNNVYVETVEQCLELLEGSTAVELLLYHRETAAPSSGLSHLLTDPTTWSCPGQCVPGTLCYCDASSCGHDATDIDPYYDSIFYPKQSQVRAKKFYMQTMLRTTGRVQPEGADLVQVHIMRMSLEQKFPFSLREALQLPGEELSPQASLLVEAVSGTTLPSTTASSSFTTPLSSTDEKPKKRIEEVDGSSLIEEEESPTAADSDAGAAEAQDRFQGSETALGEHSSSQQDLDEKPSPDVDTSSAASPRPVTLTVQDPWPWLGLREGDRLVRLNGFPVGDLDSCQEIIRESMSLHFELRPASPQSMSEDFGFVATDNEMHIPATFPPQWAKGVADEESAHCCPMPLVRRQSGGSKQVVSEHQHSAQTGESWRSMGWFLSNLCFSSSTNTTLSDRLPVGGLCSCSGVLEEAEPFNLTPEEVHSRHVTRLNQQAA